MRTSARRTLTLADLHATMRPTTCPNCDYPLGSDHQFCAACGQAVIGEDTMRSFLSHFLGDYFTFDSKIIRSAVPLLVRPGFLTAEFLAGRRARYIPPLRMFIFLSVLFFLVIGWSNASAADMDDAGLLQEQLFWDRFFNSVLPKMIFLFLPCFALLVHLFYRNKQQPFLAPFVFSMHFHAFIFLAFALYGLVSALFRAAQYVVVNQWLILALLAYTLYYLWRALHVVYRRKPLGHSLRFVGLVAVYLLLLVSGSVLAVWALW
jgi:hypothetical protein